MPILPAPSSKPGDAKYHHYVHRAYLEQFVDPQSRVPGREPYLWVSERAQLEPYAKSPRKIGGERHLYNIETETGDWSAVIENRLSCLEGPGLVALNKLAAVGERKKLSEQDLADLAAYVALADVRLPHRRDALQRFEEELKDGMMRMSASQPAYFHRVMREARAGEPLSRDKTEELRELVLAGEFTYPAHQNDWVRTMLQSVPDLAEAVARLRWTVLQAPPQSYFITSDHPVVLTLPYETPPLMSPAWGLGRVEAVIAISPRYALAMTHHLEERRIRVAPRVVTEVNTRIAYRAMEYVFSPASTPIAQIIERRQGGPRPPLKTNGSEPRKPSTVRRRR